MVSLASGNNISTDSDTGKEKEGVSGSYAINIMRLLTSSSTPFLSAKTLVSSLCRSTLPASGSPFPSMSSTMMHLQADDEDNSDATYHTARTSSFHSTANTIDVFSEETISEDDEVTMREVVGGNNNILQDHDTDGDDGSISSTTMTAAGRWDKLKSKIPQGDPLRLQHYLLRRMLGQLQEGANGNTYLAELKHKKTPTMYAVKMMRKDDIKQLRAVEKEREVLKSLDHPFLPKVYADVDSEELTLVVTDFWPRGDLRTLLWRNQLGEYIAKLYAAEVLLAMEYLHENGIVYRGLKPENVLIKEDGHIMLSSFDHAMLCPSIPTAQSRDSSAMSYFGRLVQHVLGFGSLEDNKGNRELHDAIASDWYDYGMFLYELLFGTTPFKAGDERATCVNVGAARRLKFPQQPVVSPAAGDLLKRLLAKSPKRRLGRRGGAAELKKHAFFHGINFELIPRSASRWLSPPELPAE